jgi:hypothetical protein
VLGWHRKGFGLFWRWQSRAHAGRPCLDLQLAALVRQMWWVNPTWGSKRIQAELANLAINVSDSTIHKYRPSGHPPPKRRPIQSQASGEFGPGIE